MASLIASLSLASFVAGWILIQADETALWEHPQAHSEGVELDALGGAERFELSGGRVDEENVELWERPVPNCGGKSGDSRVANLVRVEHEHLHIAHQTERLSQ